MSGTYSDGVSPQGHILADHMLLGSVVATILVIVVTAQVSFLSLVQNLISNGYCFNEFIF